MDDGPCGEVGVSRTQKTDGEGRTWADGDVTLELYILADDGLGVDRELVATMRLSRQRGVRGLSGVNHNTLAAFWTVGGRGQREKGVTVAFRLSRP